MKQHLKSLLLAITSTFILLSNIHSVSADDASLLSDADKLFNWAQNTYKEYFPSPQHTQTLDPWLYRYYPETGIYAGVNRYDRNVYVLGGSFGDTEQRIDSLGSMLVQIESSGGKTDIPACDTADVPDNISLSQSGNLVKITTYGKCIPMPDIANSPNRNICQTPHQPVATGISVLGVNSLESSEITGISGAGMSLFQSLADTTAAFQSCTINAPAGSENLVVNSDLCFDITEGLQQFSGQLTGMTISPPVHYRLRSSSSTQIVADCFATEATFVHDTYSGEAWIRNTDRSWSKLDLSAIN